MIKRGVFRWCFLEAVRVNILRDFALLILRRFMTEPSQDDEKEQQLGHVFLSTHGVDWHSYL